jgi:hypothetical protein
LALQVFETAVSTNGDLFAGAQRAMAKAGPFKLSEHCDLSRQNGSFGSLHIPISLLWEYTYDTT